MHSTPVLCPKTHTSYLAQQPFLESAIQPHASHVQAAFFSPCAGHYATAVETIIAAASAITLRNFRMLRVPFANVTEARNLNPYGSVT